MRFIKKFLTTLALGATALTASSQTNLSLPNTQPYYSVSNIIMTGSGQMIANDLQTGGAVFSYANGTNNLGQQIQPVAPNRSRYVAFGLLVTTTNTAAKHYGASLQGSTGFGDWANITNIILLTGTAGATTNTYSTNCPLADVGGFLLLRTGAITNDEAATTNSTVSTSFSSKTGI